MLRKITVIAASAVVFSFGGAFSASADAAPVEKDLSYKVYYSINGESGMLSQEDASNLLKKGLETIQSKFLTNFDLEQLQKLIPAEQKADQKEVEKKAPVKKEQPKQEVKQPAPEKQQPVEKKEEVKQPAPQVPAKEETKAPAAQPQQQTQQPAEKVEQPQQQQSALSQFEVQVVELTNQERAKQGLAPLQIDENLSKVAREKSRDMATTGYFDHNSPQYGSPFDMMKSFGIDYRTAGENIAKGQRTPEEVVNAWMNSPGHRANIMNGEFTHIGVGFVENGNHWTQMFIGK
ncbi:CAP domain-containing protein [Oceanobacillus luteolus]|uniref:CAP domain-containing protein n=1 Tax=Oceanobacillus luteolus TaxID=1274358 RepID=A0ABW4HKF2_9BACI|nr:CAP domain-containing protein [Oceanobacillus luteolus]MCM3739504.1 CAP domain-containing protein [Oceanobacillus luteolus]